MIQGVVDNCSSTHFPNNIETMHPTTIREVNLIAALFFICPLPNHDQIIAMLEIAFLHFTLIALFNYYNGKLSIMSFIFRKILERFINKKPS